MVDPNIPDINENVTRVKDLIGILNLLESETECIDNLFSKTKDDYQETVATLTIFTKTTGKSLTLINLTKVDVQENRYEINKLMSATKYFR